MSKFRVPIDAEHREDLRRIVYLVHKNPRAPYSEKHLATFIEELLDAIEKAEEES